LLRANVGASGFLAAPAAALAGPVTEPLTERPGTVIGPYKLLEQIGEGGFGVVFLAEQTQPVRRKVALKILKPGMDTRQVVARFEAERQALALMDHPNIARVYDGGATATGRPYFIMELVKGVPITEFCDQQQLTPRQRLELFVPVCQAVQHAHQKGIIHRDLKPSNVMVTVHDTTPVVKVIDFGVAKALGQELTDKSLFTGFTQMIGTPLYMSPEQAGQSGLDIDTRTDVYALGVLLYELLTGTTPFENERLRTANFDEMRRIIREEEPLKPSTRVSTLGPAAATVSANRRSDPRRLGHLFRGELDWIVMKALEKDRNRRYETASALAADVHHYLNDEPVQACPPSRWYRLSKFARRHRAALAITAVVAAAVLLTLGSLITAVRVLAISNVAISDERDQKQHALEQAVHERNRANRNLVAARKAVKDYLTRIAGDNRLKAGDFQGLRTSLLAAAIPFYEEFARQQQANPELEAERGRAYDNLAFLHQQMGDKEGALADYRRMETIFARLAESYPQDPNHRRWLVETHNNIGNMLQELDKPDEAEKAYRKALAIGQRQAEDFPSSPELREAVGRTCQNLAILLKHLSRLDEAEAVCRQGVTLEEQLEKEFPAVPLYRVRLAEMVYQQGGLLHQARRPTDAEAAIRRSLALLKDLPAPIRSEPANLQTLASCHNMLGVLALERGQPDQAEAPLREALAVKEALAARFPALPQYREVLAGNYNNLAVVLIHLGRPPEAEQMYRRALALHEKLVADFPKIPAYAVDLAGDCTNLGNLVRESGQSDSALDWYDRSITILKPIVGRDRRLAKARETLCLIYASRATTLARLGRPQDALKDLDGAVDLDDGRYMARLRVQRASTLLHLKDHRRAAADAKALAEAPGASAADLFKAACVYACAAELAGKDAALSERYAVRAVAVLRQAVARGYHDGDELRTAPDLERLRTRPDFQQLLNELQGQEKP
jgi:serine/threonine protein kinase/tetratricopeptide (TPR) repeat protein